MGGRQRTVIGVDPGTDKCGIAVVAGDGSLLFQQSLPLAEVQQRVGELIQRYPGAEVIVGRGTGRKGVLEALRRLGIRPRLVDELASTLEARRVYWQHNPPRGWRRLLPRGMLLPPEPIDGWAAYVLARRYLGLQASQQRK